MHPYSESPHNNEFACAEKDIQQEVQGCKKKVLIVDDHPIVRRGLKYIINQQNDLEVCGEAQCAMDALEAITVLNPDMAIIDISLKNSNGIELIREIKDRHPGFSILVLSMHDESVYAELVLREGAMGYIMKFEAIERLLIAVRRVLDGRIYVSDRMTSQLLHKFVNKKHPQDCCPTEMLSRREKEVFRLIGKGYGTHQIAEVLCLGVKTVETHRAHIKKKLKIESSSDLVQYSIKLEQGKIV